ncbi:hypothetical protein JW698_00475 [Candidatus Wolfebacteria bacterium]|nr:hypothetical protein [Candidatus Wolfebacteria bacterium]
MTLRKRRFYFYSFIFVFIIIGFGTAFYSLGWRITVKNSIISLQKTGGIFIQTKPKEVKIKINEKFFQDKSGFIQSGTLINNIFPGDYEMEISKNDYLNWNKKATVKSGLVEDFSKIIMVPEEIETQNFSIIKPVDTFQINSQQKIVFKSNKELYYFEKSLSSPIKLKGDEFIKWSKDNSKFIIQDSKNQTYYLYEVNNFSKTININLTLNNIQKIKIKEIDFHPNSSNRLIIKDTENFLHLLDIDRLKLETIIKEPVFAWTIKNCDIYYIKEVQKSDLLALPDQNIKSKNLNLASFNLTVKIDSFSIDFPKELTGQKPLIIDVLNDKIVFLNDTGNLYLYDRATRKFKEIAHSAEKFLFSPDNKKIAFLDKNGKINIYFLENFQRGINKKIGEIIELDFYKNLPIKNFFWYKNSSYLFIDYEPSEKNKIDFIEIDDRLPINKYTLFEEVSDFHYEINLNSLYFIRENNLFFAEF